MTNTSAMWRMTENDELLAYVTDYGVVLELLRNDDLSRRAFDKNGNEWVLSDRGLLAEKV